MSKNAFFISLSGSFLQGLSHQVDACLVDDLILDGEQSNWPQSPRSFWDKNLRSVCNFIALFQAFLPYPLEMRIGGDRESFVRVSEIGLVLRVRVGQDPPIRSTQIVQVKNFLKVTHGMIPSSAARTLERTSVCSSITAS